MLISCPATPGSRCLDTSIRLTIPTIQAMRATGIDGIGRYVPLPGVSSVSDISLTEANAITGEGLALFLVQHVRFPGWSPAAHDGEVDAKTAIAAARAAGYPDAAHLWLDLEGISGTAADTKTFAEAWARVVVGEGLRAGVYVGYDVPLDAHGLYQLHNVSSYWSDAGPRAVAIRGFSMKQHGEITVAGVRVDPDDVMTDQIGETFRWAVAAPSEDVA